MATRISPSPASRATFLCDTAGSILTVHVRGEIDHHTASGIRQGIDGVLLEKRPRRLILDLSAVSFMDSSGLGLIMGRFSVMRELGGELTVWNPSRETGAIITLAGLERLVRVEYPPDATPPEPPRRPPAERVSTRGGEAVKVLAQQGKSPSATPKRPPARRPSARGNPPRRGDRPTPRRKEKEA